VNGCNFQENKPYHDVGQRNGLIVSAAHCGPGQQWTGQSGGERPSVRSLRRQPPLLVPLTPPSCVWPLWRLRPLFTVIDQWSGYWLYTLWNHAVTAWFCIVD